MGKHLKNILEGLRQALVLDSQGDYVRPAKGDFRRDQQALNGDAKRIAADMRKTAKAYGEQIYHSQG